MQSTGFPSRIFLLFSYSPIPSIRSHCRPRQTKRCWRKPRLPLTASAGPGNFVTGGCQPLSQCAQPHATGGGPLKYEARAWAELLVLHVPRPTSSSISGNVPEWRYLGLHLRLPESSGFWPDCHLLLGFPIASFFSLANLPSLRVQSGCRKRELSTFRLPLLVPLHRLLKSAARPIFWSANPAAPRADRPIV